MQKSIYYPQVHFATDTLEHAISTFRSIVSDAEFVFPDLSVSKGNATWQLADLDEFFGECREPHVGASFSMKTKDSVNSLVFYYEAGKYTRVTVSAQDRGVIQRVSGIFDARAAESVVQPKIEASQPIVFIGHGRSAQWRDLKDHLHDVHGYEVTAYEVGSRAGHVIRDILQEMLDKSSFAILVMTGEDETADGGLRARQNVIHETGLFQGKLGFSRAIVLVEHGVEDYSNLQGIHQIRYSNGNIKETFGEILGVLRREFGNV